MGGRYNSIGRKVFKVTFPAKGGKDHVTLLSDRLQKLLEEYSGLMEQSYDCLKGKRRALFGIEFSKVFQYVSTNKIRPHITS